MNPQHPVLETGALPIELLAYEAPAPLRLRVDSPHRHSSPNPLPAPAIGKQKDGRRFLRIVRRPSPTPIYSTISITRPAPTVRPPSRMAKRIVFSMAIGVINFTSMLTLSPGITISTPSGNSMSPVTSVVRK